MYPSRLSPCRQGRQVPPLEGLAANAIVATGEDSVVPIGLAIVKLLKSASAFSAKLVVSV